jgi:ferredoxin
MMGSGGMIVMDDTTCMVDVARYFVDFLVEESCGKCVPCREGLTQMSHLLHSITGGTATATTLEALEALSGVVHDASLCALGQSAPNPVLSTLKHFRDEYLAHVRERRCPAAVCKALLTFTINDRCNGCAVCARECPAGAVAGERKKPHVIDPAKCTHCGVCRAVCKLDAVDVR